MQNNQYYPVPRNTLGYGNKPCPRDFPERLKSYWKSSLQYSLTPIQSGWMLYYADKTKNKNK